MKKVVLITGASAGIGFETARLLLAQGYKVYAAARRTEKMLPLKQSGAALLTMDVTDDASVAAGMNAIIAAEGRLDVLVNNAGFGSYGAIEDVPIADARYQLDVNVLGVARLIRLALPHMRKQHSGTIINISSIGGKIATPLGGWYHTSKFALEGLSDSLRNEVKPFGINVVVIEPGGVKSEWGQIAADHLLKTSGNTAYKDLTQHFVELLKGVEPKAAHPLVIAKLIEKAIEAKRPRPRYHAGYMASISLLMRKLLPDRLMDKAVMSQLKQMREK